MINGSRYKNAQKAWIFLGLLVLCALAEPAVAANERDVTNRVRRLENEVETLSRAIYKGEAPPPGAFAGRSEDTANLTVRLDQLETQIRELTGKLEEQNNQMDKLKNQLERMSNDIAEQANTLANNSVPYAVPPPPPPVLRQPETNDLTAPYPQDSGRTKGGNYQWSSDTAGEPTLGTLGSVSQPNDVGAIAYENAFSLLKNGQYDAAEQGFQTFLGQYPNHTLAGNAKYWLGESYYARGQYDKASRTFAEAYQEYPKGAKAPDNLLKLGLSLAGLGKKEDACIALAQIEKDFATSAGPVLRRAKQEMTNFGC
jgi:tol-pal system protein YbgF